ncbi:host cell division inhibitor Icd-like protein [Buttiauxella sp. 3AFRM03]|uniref:host cell division inhibitor Icd-like protein n=1 Tax=Buttiauxella sp. 3AFRM03 TaxID=2479367 RepID=UPI000EF75992|nr:host cell division inhibitor Icd-like protein [Buttiauxella sp. 3AFRM03]AYN27728.1 host cell division inhibitor Icd-like protein [Buttiauxella sp. 3AFRM03]
MNQPGFQKAPFPGLHPFLVCGYSFSAVAKSTAGRENPCYLLATQHAPCVFFYVVAQAHLFFGLWCLHRSLAQIMVIRAGQPSGWPVSNKAGFSPPFGSPPECENSVGGINRYLLEVALMASTLAPTHPQFVFVFAAVRRTERTSRVSMLRTVAGDEHTARLSLVRDYILSFAARLPVAEVAHA